MQDQTPIRTRPDGSIDTAYYMERGRGLRSEAAHDLTRTARRGILRRLSVRIVALAGRAPARA